MAKQWERRPHPQLKALDKYVQAVQKMQEDYWEAMKFTFAPPPTVVMQMKEKYAKIIKVDEDTGNQSVHSFVDLSNGNILKGNWKAPIRTKRGLAVRGNINDGPAWQYVNEHGPHYRNHGPRTAQQEKK